MALCLSGIDSKVCTSTISIEVSQEHQLIRLANLINWTTVVGILMKDLKKTKKFQWWLGRKINLRIHLAVFLLQAIFKMTDRATEETIKGNAFYQVFCGRTILEKWHVPDHTSIEKFRNRLTPDTQQKIISYSAKLAVELGFADPSIMDVDSTVQEANMAYPADANLLTKLGMMGKKVVEYFKVNPTEFIPKLVKKISKGLEKVSGFLGETGEKIQTVVKYLEKIISGGLDIDIKKIKNKAKAYFFMKKNIKKEKKQEAFQNLYNTVVAEMGSVIDFMQSLPEEVIQHLPWNIKRTVLQIQEHASKYLKDVAFFAKTGKLKAGKILSFSVMQVGCITKGKIGKAREFGRVFQLGRIAGNFFIALNCTSIRMEDKPSLLPMVAEHEKIFGEGVLHSLATDKGYYTKNNVAALKPKIEELGIQVPANIKNQSKEIIDSKLMDRRAGIEPLIGHVKEFGLRKSKAKSDETTIASGYRSVAGLNFHQIMRNLKGEAKKV